MPKDCLTPQEKETILSVLIGALRKSYPGTELIVKGQHKEVRYRDKLFSVQYGKDLGKNSSSRWYFGIMASRLIDHNSGAHAAFLCVDRAKKGFNVFCLLGEELVMLLMGGIPLSARERLPECKTRHGAIGAVARELVGGDVEKAKSILNVNRTVIGDCKQIENMIAEVEKMSEAHPHREEGDYDESSTHINFEVIPRGVEAEARVAQRDQEKKIFPVEWFREDLASKAFDRTICNSD
jgi:hypothetical protein